MVCVHPKHRCPQCPTPVMTQTLLTDLGLWRSQHLLRFLPYGFAVLLQLIKALLSPRAGLHFEQLAALQEELQILVIFQAWGETVVEML